MLDRRSLLSGAAAIGLAGAAASVVRAQTGPATKIVFPFAAGGSGDGLARLIADRLQAGLGRPAIVENRTGGAGRIGVQAVKAAAPDGSTLLITPVAPMSVYQHVYKKLDYDPIKDFAPVAQVASFDFCIAVGPMLAVTTLKELVAWAKANPDKANYGSPAAGALPHFFGVLFAAAAGIDARHVSYRGAAAATADLVGGQLPFITAPTADLIAMHKGQRVRILATSGKARSPLVPDVPTFREAGYDIEGVGWYGLFAPAGTPAETIARINRIVVDAVRDPALKDRILTLGLEPTGTSPEQLGAIQKADAAFWAPAVKASGFVLD